MNNNKLALQRDDGDIE
jgi:hypothetical protein